MQVLCEVRNSRKENLKEQEDLCIFWLLLLFKPEGNQAVTQSMMGQKWVQSKAATGRN